MSIFQACLKKDFKLVQKLIDSNENINLKDNNGNTPLLLASHEGNNSLVKFLVSKGANIDAKNNAGKGILQIVRDVKLTNYIVKTLRQRVTTKLEQFFIKDLAGMVAGYVY